MNTKRYFVVFLIVVSLCILIFTGCTTKTTDITSTDMSSLAMSSEIIFSNENSPMVTNPPYPSITIFESSVPKTEEGYQYPEGFYTFENSDFTFYHTATFWELWQQEQLEPTTQDGTPLPTLDSFGELSYKLWNCTFTEEDLRVIRQSFNTTPVIWTFDPYDLLELDEITTFPEKWGEVSLTWSFSTGIDIHFENAPFKISLVCMNEWKHDSSNTVFQTINQLSDELLPGYQETEYHGMPAWKFEEGDSTVYYQKFTVDDRSDYLTFSVDSNGKIYNIYWYECWKDNTLYIEFSHPKDSEGTEVLEEIYNGFFVK